MVKFGILALRENILKYNWVPLVITILLVFSLFNPLFFKNTLAHDAPQGYLAGDAYWHLSYVTYLIDKGYYTEEPGFTTGYNPDRITSMEPPLFFYAASLLSNAIGIQDYDAAIFLLFIMVVCGLCALYLISVKIHRLLPYFSLPPSILLAAFPFSAGISWGFWKFYLAGLLLFISIAIILLTERSIKQSAVLGILLSAIIASHITMALYLSLIIAFSYFYDWASKRWTMQKAISELAYPAATALIGLILGLDYLIEFYAARIAGNSVVASAINAGYTLFGANPYVNNLGIIFWIALAGIIIGVLFLGHGEGFRRKAIILFVLLFLLMLGPLFGYDRIYQFRLLWPLYISLCFGLAFLLPLKLLGEKLSPFLGLLAFAGFSIFLFTANLQDVKGIGDMTYSLVEPEYWNAIENLSSQEGARIYLIDPGLTQAAISFNLKQYTRYLEQSDYGSNNSILGPSTVNCVPPNKIRVGFLRFENNTISAPYCKKEYVELCSFDYFLIHTAPSDQAQYDWLVRQLELLENHNLALAIYSEQTQALILKNQAVC